MNKYFLLSVTLSTLFSISSQASEDLSSMFSEGKASGQIRMFSISRALKFSNPDSDEYTRKANAIGGHLKFETAQYQGVTLGTALYTTNGFLLDDDRTNPKKVDPTLFGANNSSYSILGEAYIKYQYKNTELKFGRQKINSPLAGADDGRMLPNLFQAYTLINKDLSDTTLYLSHATHFAQGTFGRIYYAESGLSRDKILAATSAYSAVNDRDQVGKFVNIGTYALGERTDGLSIASVTYSGVKNLKLQAWDYYAHDILNAIYLQADYKWELGESLKPYASAQYIKQNDVGEKLLQYMGGEGDLDSNYWALKLGLKIENFSSYLAHSQVSKNSETDPTYANATITMWGGMPAFIQGMLTRLAGTKASKVYVDYNWRAFGPNLLSTAYYAKFDMGAYNGWTEGDADEIDFSLKYYPKAVKNLELRLRANFSNDFLVLPQDAGTVGWQEYHFIAKYNF